MNRVATIGLTILTALAGTPASAQDQAALARKFIGDAQGWLNAPGLPLIDDEPVAFVQVTEAANAAEVRRQIGDKRIFNSVAADNTLRKVLNDASVDSVRLVATNLAALQKPPGNTPLRLCDGSFSYCRAVTTSAWRGQEGGREFTATLSADGAAPAGQALLVEGKSGFIGQVALSEGTFTLRSIAPSILAVTSRKTTDTDRDPNDVDPTALRRAALNSAALADAQDPLEQDTSQCANPAQSVQVDVVVGITLRAARQALDVNSLDVRHLLTFSESLANQSLKVSQINGTLHVADVVDVDYQESGNFQNDVAALLAKDKSLKALLSARSQRRADIAILVVDHADDRTCGQAAGIRVDSAQAFAVVNWKCLTDRFSFAHEVGHLVGAWHDPVTLERQLGAGEHARPAYAQGYVAPGPRPFVTIMGYPNACPEKCGRMWFWANPELLYGGRAVGTPNKNFDACIWRRRLTTVAAFDGR